MSDFSDRLRSVFEDITETAQKEDGSPYSFIGSQDEAKKSPLSDNFMAFDNVWSHKFYALMRRRYRFQAGTDNPDNYPDMHEKIKTLVHEELINFYLRCVAAGVQVGEESTVMVRRALHLEKLRDLYGQEDFASECALMAMHWQDDYETRKLIGDYMEGSAVTLASQVGLPRSEDPNMINRAWDVWCVAGRSLTSLAYSVGEQMGRENKENDILKHAAQQMESTDE